MARSVTAPIVRIKKKKKKWISDKVSFCSFECPVLSGKRFFPAVVAVILFVYTAVLTFDFGRKRFISN